MLPSTFYPVKSNHCPSPIYLVKRKVSKNACEHSFYTWSTETYIPMPWLLPAVLELPLRRKTSCLHNCKQLPNRAGILYSYQTAGCQRRPKCLRNIFYLLPIRKYILLLVWCGVEFLSGLQFNQCPTVGIAVTVSPHCLQEIG